MVFTVVCCRVPGRRAAVAVAGNSSSFLCSILADILGNSQEDGCTHQRLDGRDFAV